MVAFHVSGGVPEQTVGDEAMGVHTVDEWKCSLQGQRPVRLGPRATAHPPVTAGSGLTMPVSDVKMTISYRGASCWNNVSMPGRFLNLQPVASCRASEDRGVLRPDSPKGQDLARGSPSRLLLAPGG